MEDDEIFKSLFGHRKCSNCNHNIQNEMIVQNMVAKEDYGKIVFCSRQCADEYTMKKLKEASNDRK